MKLTRHGMKLVAASAVFAFAIGGCTQPPAPTENAPTTESATESDAVATGTTEMTDSPDKAIAVLHPTEGNKVGGTVTFTKEADGVRVVANLNGLTPGEHGFHVHETGDCSSADGSSAGGHFNPEDQPHGAPDSEARHTGDFGNITADEAGNATYDRIDKNATLSGKDSVIGRAVIVHAKADDLKSQPSGDAGSREACGVIGVAQ